MKSGSFVSVGSVAIFLAACAVDPATQMPPRASQPAPDLSRPVAVQPGQIAQCNHAGAPSGEVQYPDGWQARLQAGASPGGGGDDELLGGLTAGPAEVEARDAQPVRPPRPAYPVAAGNAAREAQCYALLDVETDGEPADILTACSSPEFNATTYQAVSGMRFSPPRRDGRAVRLVNVVYPVTYCRDEY
jgi:outer membrane biosynthesis protein TonB